MAMDAAVSARAARNGTEIVRRVSCATVKVYRKKGAGDRRPGGAEFPLDTWFGKALAALGGRAGGDLERTGEVKGG